MESLANLQSVFLLGSLSMMVYILYRWFRGVVTRRYWADRANKRRISRDAEIAQIQTTNEMVDLSSMSALEILDRIKQRKLKSEQVLRFYFAKCLEAQNECNCITEIMFESSLKRAKELDRILETTNKPVGPLHGLPISIKESIRMKGTHSTAGYAHQVDQTSHWNGVIVEILQEAGAIIFVKTNVPQTLLTNESSNKIYGVTTNPWNKKRTCGGSSGGEAALIACGGSPIGIGTDIGGSVRIPCHYSGICGMKPTVPRFSFKGANSLDSGNRSILPTWGPMGQCVDDLEYLLNVVQVLQPQFDVALPPLEWKTHLYKGTHPLNIGYYTDDGFFESSRSCQRAVQEAIEVLKDRGHNVQVFSPPNVKRAAELYFYLMTADELKNMTRWLSNEELDPSLSSTNNFFVNLPSWIPRIFFVILRLLGKNRFADISSQICMSKNVPDVWKAQSEMDNYKANFLHEMSFYDVIITPATSTPAPQLFKGQWVRPTLQCTYLYNFLHLPAGIVPVTIVSEEDTKSMRKENDMMDSISNEIDIGSEGLPVGVQVVGKPYQDELVLRVMKEIEDRIGFEKHLKQMRNTISKQTK